MCMKDRKIKIQSKAYTLIALFAIGVLTPLQAVDSKDTQKLDKIIKLPAGRELKLNSNWMKYTSKKILSKISSYPMLENKNHHGLMGTLNTEVKFFNKKREGNITQWFGKECNRLKDLYPPQDSKVIYEKEKLLCKIELHPSSKTKGMIQYLKAKNIRDNKVFIYSYNFFTPLKKSNKLAQWTDMKKEVSKLMEANL